jgi:undecaprenyl diphosphate synthase
VVTVSARQLPRHVGIILDGNGRWAQLRGLPRTEGHRRGSEAVRRVVRAARRLGISALTLYSFSAQNWSRPREEVDILMELLREYLLSERSEILDHGIRLVGVGELDRLPPRVRETLDELERVSAPNEGMVLALALSYGGREELATAARVLATRAARGELDPASITAESLDAVVPSVAHGQPDLIVRTGGEVRLSNFLLWGSAYAELHFTDRLWPDFDADDLYRAVGDYQTRQRRFGGLPAPGVDVVAGAVAPVTAVRAVG